MEIRHGDKVLAAGSAGFGLTLRRRDARVDADVLIALDTEAHRARCANVETCLARYLDVSAAAHTVEVECGVDRAVPRLEANVGFGPALRIRRLKRDTITASDGAVLANDGADVSC